MEFHVVTIYDHPLDYPKHWVARSYRILNEGPYPGDIRLADTLEEARECVRHLVPTADTCLPRQLGDDPTIVESWI